MAFVLPVIAEAAALLAEGATEEAVVSQLGEKFSNSIAAEVASRVSSYLISHADEIMDTVFGQGTAEEFHKELNKNIDESTDFLTDFEFGYPVGTSEAKRKQNQMTEEKARQARIRQKEKEIYEAEVNKTLADLYRKEHENPSTAEHCHCNDSESLEPTTISKLPVEPMTNNGTTIIDPNAVTDSPVKSLSPHIELLTTKPDEYGARTAEFIVKFMLHSLESKDVPISEFYMNNPHLMQIGKHYLEWASKQKNVPVSKDSIYQTYNGKSLSVDKMFKARTDTGTFYAINDEVGNLEVYTGRAAPKGASVTTLLGLGFIPPIHGVWMGPKSPNNALPIDLVDLFSFMHDTEYNKHGWFYETADAKYISRLSQNIDRMGFVEAQFAKFGIKWFSTIGLGLAKVAGTLKDPTENENDVSNDFFSYLHQVSQGTVSDNTDNDAVGSYIEYNVDKLNRKIESRKIFYQNVKKTAEELYVQNAPPIKTDVRTRKNRFQSNPLLSFIKSLPVVEYTS